VSGACFEVNEDIYGPFEAGFGSQQDGILAGLGCNPGSLGHVQGGIDTRTAEAMVSWQCKIELPRFEQGGRYVSLLDTCGGHTREYHFHERLSCLYNESDLGDGLGSAVGVMNDGKLLFGRIAGPNVPSYEGPAGERLPFLDACGGAFDRDGLNYHYHVQVRPPFTVGCFGPALDDNGAERPVTLAECRALYSGCAAAPTTVVTASGAADYALWCPCYDRAGSNVGKIPLRAFATTPPYPSPPPWFAPLPACDSDRPGWASHRTLVVSLAARGGTSEGEVVAWTQKLCCVYTHVEVAQRATSQMTNFDGSTIVYDGASFEEVAAAAYDDICDMPMGSTDCASCWPSSPPPLPPPSPVPWEECSDAELGGDFNGVNNFTISDALYVAQMWSGKAPRTACMGGDLNGSGSFTIADAVLVAMVYTLAARKFVEV